jgi:hypothetical protein
MGITFGASQSRGPCAKARVHGQFSRLKVGVIISDEGHWRSERNWDPTFSTSKHPRSNRCGRPPPRLARQRPAARRSGRGGKPEIPVISFDPLFSWRLVFVTGRCETLKGDDLRKTPPARGLPCCRSCAGHRSCNRFPVLSPWPQTRARDQADSPPPCAQRC